jgi:hypothetical protein
MAWRIEYYNTTVEQAILDLPPGLLARYLRLADLMIEFGPNLSMPHTRAIGEGLFELRVKGREGIAKYSTAPLSNDASSCSMSLLRNRRRLPNGNLT